jgi:hypothetical protein
MHQVRRVGWNQEAANDALAYVNSITTMAHSETIARSPLAGENLAHGLALKTLDQVVAAWHQEVDACVLNEDKDYVGEDGKLNGCELGQPVLGAGIGQYAETGHFTAMVWRGVREIGCAVQTLNIDAKFGPIWICRYVAGPKIDLTFPNTVGGYVLSVMKQGPETKDLCTASASSLLTQDMSAGQMETEYRTITGDGSHACDLPNDEMGDRLRPCHYLAGDAKTGFFRKPGVYQGYQNAPAGLTRYRLIGIIILAVACISTCLIAMATLMLYKKLSKEAISDEFGELSARGTLRHLNRETAEGYEAE